MRFASLGSGSRGNATVLQQGSTTVLVDCGFSLSETERRLERLQLRPDQLSAILVTHEHSDHCAGVGKLSRRHQLPVYMTHGTHKSGRCDDVHELNFFHSEAEFFIGELLVKPLAVPHDAREPCQFVFCGGGKSVGVLTDLGNITAAVVGHYQNCAALLLECNHDVEMLRAGPYPPALQRRVGGAWGHLNNQQAAQLLAQVGGAQLQHLVVAHISEKNNTRDRVISALTAVYERCDELVWADQQQGFSWLQLD